MYIKHNVNPLGKKTGDCAIRAVAVATGIGWENSYDQLALAGKQCKCCMSDIEAVDLVLKNNGFLEGKIKISKGDRRPTVDSFSREHPDMYMVLRVANHLVAAGKGNYVDIWDSGDCAVYKYWYKYI